MRDGVAEMDHGNAGWIKTDTLYPDAFYRKLVTDKDGYLVDPDFISAQIKAGDVLAREAGATNWWKPSSVSVSGITRLMEQNVEYKLKGDV
jgi:hypothetical protein